MATRGTGYSHSGELTRTVHGGDWQGAVDRYGWRVDEILDFSANINPLGPPAGVLAVLKENLAAIQRYPDPASRRFKEALASSTQLETGSLIAANGAVELIYLVLQVLKPQRVLVSEPTFSEYHRAARAAGAGVVTITLDPEADFSFDLERWRRELPGVQLAFICNPDNPTGRLLAPNILQEVVNCCQAAGVFLVVDESFLDFIPNGEEYSLARLAATRPGLLILHSLTKIYALPGLRLGYGVGHPELVSRLETGRDPWSVNILAQMAGVIALGETGYIKETQALIGREKEFLWQHLAKLAGFQPYNPEVNFILTRILDDRLAAPVLAELLARRGILIRDCSSFPGLGPHYFRVAVRDRQANERLLAALGELVAGIPASEP
ncbi:threonine-phosphate decarboxylase CobD [Moorella naiadis]|uniref:threonine-phosphate decarboxylase CobD n=1 Tax=Moorella naiadis (nom. illeg.) TaxID=3093670 RepID=UPI003D9CAA7F